MYRFDIVQQKEGTWKFELDGINLILDGYEIVNGRHKMINPEKAIAYFNVKGHMYGLSNQFKAYSTVEEFFDMMKSQYSIFFRDAVPEEKEKEEELQQAS